MSQAKKLSRHNSRQSSINCDTTSVCSNKSDAKSNSSASGGGSDYTINSHGSNSNNNNYCNKVINNNKSNGTLHKTSSLNGSGGSSNGQDCNDIKSSQKQASILNVAEMLLHGVADNEILDIWLKSIECDEFVCKFIDAGYDMPTISRITPQDLTAIGVTEPTKRVKILTEIKKLNLQDGIPTFKPNNLSHWLSLIRLDSYYYKSLCDQQIDTCEKMCQLTWEDFEELGITKLGHQKRFQLAIERFKELDNSDSRLTKNNNTKIISEPIYDTNPSQILLVASTENHSMNGPIINKQSSTSELSSTGSGSMHSVYSAASTHYQPTYGPSITDNNQLIVGNQHQNINNIHNNTANNSNNNNQNPNQNYTPPSLPQTPQLHQQQQQQQQQQIIYSQAPPPSLIYQSPAQLLSSIMPPKQQSHYQQHQPFDTVFQQQQLTTQIPNQSQQQQMLTTAMINEDGANLNNMDININGIGGNGMIMVNQQQQQQQQQMNRQSMSQLSFSALANLPKHQQEILQQSSIYATLSRQPAKSKQPPPPVPIRTNSLKTNSLTDDVMSQQQQIMNNNSHKASTCSLYRSATNRIPNCNDVNISNSRINQQFNSQTMLTKNKSFSGHNAHMEATRARFLNYHNNNNNNINNNNTNNIQQQFSQLPTQLQQPIALNSLPPPQTNQLDQLHTTQSQPQMRTTQPIYGTQTSTTNQCNATTGKDDDFPPPPSPLSIVDLDEQNDIVSLNSDSTNFSDVAHANQFMTFRVGI